MSDKTSEESNIFIYKNSAENTKVDVFVKDETVWLTQTHIVQLFQSSKSNISEHITDIFTKGELEENSVVRKFRTTAKDGKNYNVKHYNLDVIIAVGYRVNSKIGIDFRKWATEILKSYAIKGFALDDERLKKGNNPLYFEELLERIKDIRSSEKQFWRKVLDIYATSIDYDSNSKLTIKFFRTVQNKMHYATHGNTAAEIIYNRVNSEKGNIGLISFTGSYPTRKDTEIAKNYLTLEELKILNKMVSAYLDVAELQALRMKTMTMKDWIRELDKFLTMTRSDILNNNGIISHKKALEKAHKEYEKYITKTLTPVERDYIEIINKELKNFKEVNK